MMFVTSLGLFFACKPEPEPEPTYCLTFYTNDVECDEKITVNLYNNKGYDEYEIVSSIVSSTPDCGDSGCATFCDLQPGKYYYDAYSDDYEWEGEINISKTCTVINLSTSNAIPKYCLTFWTNDDDCYEDITVNLYNYNGYDEESDITMVLSSTPDCGDSGCATFCDLQPGKYYYDAYSDDYEWEGEINISKTCTVINLSTSNAIPKYCLTFWTNDDDCYEDITVNLYNYNGYDEESDITMVLSSTPDCGDSGCATFCDLQPGKYYYDAYSDDYEWEGEININETCELINLNSYNAIPKTATVTFWINSADCIQKINVNLWKSGNPSVYDEYATIESYYDTYNPYCGDDGCANFYNVEYGEYAYYAENDYYTWYGHVTVDFDCERMLLLVSDAKTKEGVQPSNSNNLRPSKSR